MRRGMTEYWPALVDLIGIIGYATLRTTSLHLAFRACGQQSHITSRSASVDGDEVRDWVASGWNLSIFPYVYGAGIAISERSLIHRHALWPSHGPMATGTCSTAEHVRQIRADAGCEWYEFDALTSRARFPLTISIAFAFVATHNHFVLDRGGKVFNQSAPDHQASRRCRPRTTISPCLACSIAPRLASG